jgi:hypothetical protein
MATMTAMRTPAVPAMEAPANCDEVRGDEIGDELCGAEVDVALVSRLGTETENSVDNVESQATIKFNTERTVVELFQWDAAEVYRASILVLSGLVMSWIELAILLKSGVGLAILKVVVVFRAWCPGSPFEDRWWRIEEAVFNEELIVVAIVKVVRLARCNSAPCSTDMDGIVVLSEMFEVIPVSRWDAPGDVIAVYTDLWLLIGDGTEDTVILLGIMKVPVLDVVGIEVLNDTELTAVEIGDGEVVESSRVERADDRTCGAKEAMNDTLLVTTGNGAWKDVRVATKQVWCQVFSKP